MIKDPNYRGQVHKYMPLPRRSTSQVKTFSFNEKKTSDRHKRREKAHKSCPRSRTPDFQVKDQDFQLENQPLKT